MINYSWEINNLICYEELNGQTNVVFKVEWSCLAQEQIGDNTYSTQWLDKTLLNVELNDQFTPYQQLTEQQILGWIWQTGVNKADIESRLTDGLTEQKTAPVIIDRLPPWSSI
jgi:hypothetical protein